MKTAMPNGADPASVIDYLIVGGGLAGATAADTLRREGATGSVAILSAEDMAPYHRPRLRRATSLALPAPTRCLKPIGGRQRENMTLSAEKALLGCFAKAAGAGEILNIQDLKAAYEQAIGHPTSNSTIYNLLNRHGWRKLTSAQRTELASI
jgi:2-polyprenyl-6-methoxyphenol hydroxylase-like FAD-dependent oxidoreductase